MRFLQSSPLRHLGLVLFPLFALSGCDNPTCVFTTPGCNPNGPDPDQLGPAEASSPSDGSRVLGAAPMLEETLPSGNGVFPTSPIVLRFSESMNPSSLEGAFELGDRFSGEVFALLDQPILVGDGRIVVLQPASALPDDREFELVLTPTARISDITGQEWVWEAGLRITAFGTDEAMNPIPRVYMTEPSQGALNVSDLTEVSVVFDRSMDPSGFDSDSMAVAIAGVDPSPNPEPESGFAGASAVTSVWTWQSEDEFGSRVSLGVGASGRLALSTSDARLTDEDGAILPTTNINFTLAGVGSPVAGFKPFGAQDAIGLPDLLNLITPVIQVELLEPALAGDELFVYAFGTAVTGTEQVAFERSLPILNGAVVVDLFANDLGLLDAMNLPLLRDGTMQIACAVSRGSVRSGLRVLDGSPLLDGIQDYGFDTQPPGIASMAFNDTFAANSNFLRSDQRDLVAFGLASEALAGARVSSALGNNVGVLDPPAPTQVGELNIFVAAPVPLGILDPAMGILNFTVQAFDQALNTPPEAFAGEFEQIGIASTGSILAGGTVQVWVHDSETFEPLSGARVFTHQDNGGAITAVANGPTSSSGLVELNAAAAGETLVTVDLAGYDLFTFHGAPRDKIQVLLDRTVTAMTPVATWTGQVQSVFPAAPLVNVDVFVSDTRLKLDGPLWREPAPCVLDSGAGLYRCEFIPEVGRTNRVGFGSFIAGDTSLPQAAFSPLAFLSAYGWETGQTLLTTVGLGTPSILFVDSLLNTGVIEDLPIEVPAQVLSTIAAPNLGTITEAPRVMLDGLSPGMGRPILVGLGIAYDAGANTWDIRSAIPGVVDGVSDNVDDALGVLVEFGTLDPDHFVRVEVEDDDGNLTVIRRPISQLDGNLLVTDVAQLQSPSPGGLVSSTSYTVTTTDPLRDGLGMGGMYEVRLSRGAGRSWSLWRSDPADGVGSLSVALPDIAASGGSPLPNGTITCEISFWAAPGLDETQFMWADLHRDAHRYSRSEPFTFTQN